jgi:hypothetical protein
MQRLATSLFAATSVLVGFSHAQTPSWAEVTTANTPSARVTHAMAYDSARGKVVMFGGGTATGTATGTTNDTWEYDGVNWTQVMTASSPSPRSDHEMVYDSARGKVVMVGGFSFADTWEFDGVDWTEVTTANQPGLGGILHRHAMAYDSAREKVVIFGGEWVQGNFLDSTWEYDGVDWTHVTTANVPAARGRHSMAYDSAQGKIIMFGGAYSPLGGGPDCNLNDTWEYDGVDWTEVTTIGGPGARSHHAMAYDSAQGKIVMFGGLEPCSGQGWPSDTWQYDGVDWAEVTTAGIPSVYGDHAMAFDSARGKVVMFGGVVPGVGYGDDTREHSVLTFATVYGNCDAGAPCGNPDPSAGCANSRGEGSRLNVWGSASVAADDLRIVATNLPHNQYGLYFMGSVQIQLPFGDGQRCVAGGATGLSRFPIRNSGLVSNHGGTITEGPGIVAYSQANFTPANRIQAGQTWNFQHWHRDPQGPCASSSNLTNAVAITFAP